MSERLPELLLEDILEAITKIQDYTKDMSLNSFGEDEKTIDAVVRNLEIIGEAANKLPLQFKESNTSIEWYKIIGLRNRVIHEYFGVDYGIIWHIVQNNLPELKIKLEALLKK